MNNSCYEKKQVTEEFAEKKYAESPRRNTTININSAALCVKSLRNGAVKKNCGTCRYCHQSKQKVYNNLWKIFPKRILISKPFLGFVTICMGKKLQCTGRPDGADIPELDVISTNR